MNLAEQWDALPAGRAAPNPAWPSVNAETRAAQPLRDARASEIVAGEGGPPDARNPIAGIQARDIVASRSAPLADEWDSIGAQKTPPSPTKASWPSGLVNQIPGRVDVPPTPKAESIFDRYIRGPAEAATTLATGAIAAPIGFVMGAARAVGADEKKAVKIAQDRAAEVQDYLTYHPQTESAKDILSTGGKIFSASKLQGLGPTEAIALSDVLAHARTTRGVNQTLRDSGLTPSAAGAGPSGESAIGVVQPRYTGPSGEAVAAPPSAAGAFGSVGAQGASIAEQARALSANASPETRAMVAKAGDKINLDALKRHIEADALPIPVALTKGQATGDIRLLSTEQNQRGKYDQLHTRFADQNKALIENTQAIREAAAPDVYVRSKPDVGATVIDAYLTKDRELNAAISQKYQALRDANGGQFPLDSKAFVNAADKALHKELLYDHLPPELRRTMDRVATDGMTFENFESLRTNLARIQRSPTADGNIKAAAGVIRDTLETLPMPAGAEHLKPLADAARAAARERFALIEGDPAYKAVTRGAASADKFIDKHIINADLRHVQRIRENLSHDPAAQQALAAGVVDRLTESAGVRDGAGNFSQAGYNRALEAVRPKLRILFSPEQVRQIETLGKVARYTQEQPRGAFVNNSNTLVGALAEGAKEAGKTTLEGVANVAAKGMPIGSWVRRTLENRAINKEINESLKPGAGILLKDVGK